MARPQRRQLRAYSFRQVYPANHVHVTLKMQETGLPRFIVLIREDLNV